MKSRFLTIPSFILSFVVLTAFQISENCDSKAIKSVLKRELIPEYRYDSSKIMSFTTTGDFQGKKIEIPLYKTENYRFVFNTKGADKNFQIYVSTHKDSKKGKILFALKDVREAGKDTYVFDPETTDKLYITYIIPPAVETTSEFCVAFMIGYKV